MPCGACECKVQAVVPCRTGNAPFGQINNRPGRSGRSQDSNALPGHFLAAIPDFGLPFENSSSTSRLASRIVSIIFAAPRKTATKFTATTLLYRGDIVRRNEMVITADERRNVLGLFNVSETARQLGVPVRKMHWDIRAGNLPAPQIRLGRRAYYAADDLKALEQLSAQRTSHL